jgi:hypothetical protein
LADAAPENSTIAEEVWHRYKSFRSLRSDLAGVSTRGFNGLNESQPTRVKARPRLVRGRPSVVHSIAMDCQETPTVPEDLLVGDARIEPAIAHLSKGVLYR